MDASLASACGAAIGAAGEAERKKKDADADADERAKIAAALSDRFVLPADEATALAASLGLPSPLDLLPKLVSSASKSARVPTSRYRVGAAALGASGRVFVGCNLELPRAPLAQSVHAEQFVVALAAQRGERGIRRIAVSAPPCGHCRQFCCELNCADVLEFAFGEEDEGGAERGEGRPETSPSSSSPPSSSVATLRALLPRHFGPEDLARASGKRPKLLLDDSGVSLELTPGASAAVAAAAGDGGGASPSPPFPVRVLAAAAEAALSAARASHTPHTRCPAGLALVWRKARRKDDGRDDDGGEETLRVSAGGAIESAAYNPTLPPLQAALVAAVADGMPPCRDPRGRGARGEGGDERGEASVVVGAVLVERRRARVSHASATRAALAAFSPSGSSPPPPLVVLHARGSMRVLGASEGESGYESGEESEATDDEGDGGERGDGDVVA